MVIQEIYDRIQERLTAMGLGHREACRLAGIGVDTIRNLKRGVDGVQKRTGISGRSIAALAPVLGTTSAYLLEGITEPVIYGTPLVEWTQLAPYADRDRPLAWDRELNDEYGRYPMGCFVTRVADDAMNRVSPVGSFIIVDRNDRSLVEGRAYVGVIEGQAVYRRWAADPPRAEPCSLDISFRTQFLSTTRRWQIIGRVRRTLLDV